MTWPIQRKPACRASRNGGTVLVVGLIILLVMTILGLGSMHTSVLEELMTGQAKQQNSAFQAAEAGMQAALSYLAALRAAPAVTADANATVWPGCQVTDSDQDCGLLFTPAMESWKTYDPDDKTTLLKGKAMDTLTGVGWTMNETGAKPHFVIESRYAQPLDFEDAARRKGYHFFTVAAVGLDPGTNSQAILQSTVTKLFP